MKKIITTLLLSILTFSSLAIVNIPSQTANADTICWFWEDDCVLDGEKSTDEDIVNEGNTDVLSDDFSAIKTPSERLSELGGEGEYGISSFNTGQHPDAAADYTSPGAGAITSPIYYGIDLFKYLISGMALIIIIVMAIKLIITGSEEEYTNARNGLIMGLLGFIVIQLADYAVKEIFFGEFGEALSDTVTAKEFAETGGEYIRGIIGGLNLFLASVAVFALVVRGYKVLTAMGDEEQINKAKNHIIYIIIGLVIIGISDLVVRGFLFPKSGEVLPDVDQGKKIVAMITNYVAGFISVLAFVALFYGGYRYVISAGDDEAKENFKKIIISVVLAILLSIGAFALVNTLLNV